MPFQCPELNKRQVNLWNKTGNKLHLKSEGSNQACESVPISPHSGCYSHHTLCCMFLEELTLSSPRGSSKVKPSSCATLNPLALSPHPIMPPIILMTLNWSSDSKLWHTGWVAYLQFSSWNLQLDPCQTPPVWPWQDWAAVPLVEILPLTRAVNHNDTRAVTPHTSPGWY